jgi:hypothetical protein
MTDVLSLLWTNLLWRNLAVEDEQGNSDHQDEYNCDKHNGIQTKACSSETLSWLTSRPFSGLHNVLKLKKGHLLATMVFAFLYAKQAALGMFTTLNPISTIQKGSNEEKAIDSGWFHLKMPDKYILGSFTANLQVSTNEVHVEVDGKMMDVWLPPSLQLSEWYDVATPVLLPKVTCYAEPLKGDWDGRTIYPFGRGSSSNCSAYLPYWNEDNVTHKIVADTGITLPEELTSNHSSFGCFDYESGQGLMVFLYRKEKPVGRMLPTEPDNITPTDPDDFGVIEHNAIFGNLSFDKIQSTVTGIPCNYTLRTANVTFTKRNGKIRGTLQASSERNFELPNLRTIFSVMNNDLFFATGNFQYVTALHDFMFDLQYIDKGTSRDLSYYNQKVKHLLGVPVYAHTPHLPITIKGVPWTVYYKLEPVTSWWGVLGTTSLCFLCLFMWWYTVAIGPKRAFWHSDSRDNSWNYLFAYFMPHMSPDDAYNKNTCYYEDAGSHMIKVDRVETDPDMYPGMTRTRRDDVV